jgi:hypothetical protein
MTAKAFPTVSQDHFQAILIIHNLIDLQLLKQKEEHLIIFNVIMIVKFILKQTLDLCTKEGI